MASHTVGLSGQQTAWGEDGIAGVENDDGAMRAAFTAKGVYYGWSPAPGAAWRTVQAAADVDTPDITLALDDQDAPHIAFAEAGQLHHLRPQNHTWISHTVDAAPHGLDQLHMAAGEGSQAHLVYRVQTSDDRDDKVVRYAHFDGSAWSHEDLAQVGRDGGRPQVVVQDGQVYVAYLACAAEPHQVMLATRQGNGWQRRALYTFAENECGFVTRFIMRGDDKGNVAAFLMLRPPKAKMLSFWIREGGAQVQMQSQQPASAAGATTVAPDFMYYGQPALYGQGWVIAEYNWNAMQAQGTQDYVTTPLKAMAVSKDNAPSLSGKVGESATGSSPSNEGTAESGSLVTHNEDGGERANHRPTDLAGQ